MRTNLKVILAAAAIAALASPVMAQSESHPHAAPLAAGVSNAHGHVVRARTARPVAGAVEGGQYQVDDCVHVAFPQCSDDGRH